MTETSIVDIFIEQGTDWTYTFDIDPSIDLSGAAAAMQIRTLNGATYIVTLTSADNLTINASANTITATLPFIKTDPLVPGEYLYDIKVGTSENKRYRPVEGNAIIDPQVTTAALPTGEILQQQTVKIRQQTAKRQRLTRGNL